MSSRFLFRTSLFAALICLLLTACGQSDSRPKTRFSPYSLENFGAPALAKDKALKNYTEIVTNYDLSNGSSSTDSCFVEFNEYGQILSNWTYPSVITYSYDAEGHITNIDAVSSYKALYNEEGDLIEESYFFGDLDDYGEEAEPERRLYKYDSEGRIEEVGMTYEMINMTHSFDSDGRLVRKDTYGVGYHGVEYFDANGVVVTQEEYGENPTSDKETLLSTTNYEYEFDPYGNWTKRTAYQKVPGFKKPKVVGETVRRIEYFDDSVVASLAAADTPAYSAGGSTIDNYLSDLSYRWRRFGYTNGASTTMLIILLVLTAAFAASGLWWMNDNDKFPGFSGTRDKNGMKRLWMYNWQPYASAGLIEADIVASFIAAILVMLLIGVIVWCIFGLVKLILWAVVIVGWILLIFGILGIIAKEGFGCLGVLIGGAIVAAQDWCEKTGNQFVEWGDNFMAQVNMMGFGYNLVANFWDVVLIIALIPLAIFLAIAALFIILSMILTGIEWVITKIYSIRRPCPECGSTDRFEYMVNGRPHPVALRPGVYGVFHQTRYQPYNTNGQYRVPTMLMNGRGRLDRRCESCGAMISATGQHAVGTDVHIGFVGHVGAGKSYLIYGGLGALMENNPDKMEQINSGNDDSLDISSRSQQITMNRNFKTDKRSSYRAIEVMVDVPGRPVPYHVHVYDVAGEQFAGSSATSATDTAAMKFYTNVRSVVLVIDPTQLDLTAPGMMPSAEFEQWQSEHNRSSKRYNIADIFSSLEGYLNHYGRSGSLKDIDVSIVVVKSDLGFFEALNYPANPSEGDVESFVNQALGLQSLVNTARKFHSVSFYATSAVADDKSSLIEFFTNLLRQRGVNIAK